MIPQGYPLGVCRFDPEARASIGVDMLVIGWVTDPSSNHDLRPNRYLPVVINEDGAVILRGPYVVSRIGG